jgi:UDP-N-acetylglucosamine 1-carboxyvinyltransferase
MNSSATTSSSQPESINSKAGPKDKIMIRGGKPLRGTVRTSGAKNAVLKQIAACVMVPGKVILKETPPLQDVFNMVELIEFLGGKCEFDQANEILQVDCTNLNNSYAPFELVSKLRASFVILGPLLSRLGSVKVSLPGGCQIGTRRVDLHEKGLKALGANIEINHGYVEAECPKGRLIGKDIYLDIPSNGATENLMMAAILAEGVTTIDNAAKDPEIEDLALFLNACGAKIEGAGTQKIKITGVTLDQMHGAEYTVMPDRIEAGTFIMAALVTKGSVLIENVVADHLSSLLSKLEEMGANIELLEGNSIRASATERLKSTEISTVWYPGFATDLQPQIMALLATAEGTSIVKENIYEDRFSHIEELMRMGANIQVTHNVAVLKGVESLSGANVTGGDLRATAGLIIAGLAAEGVTEVFGLSHLDRGYSRFTEKLQKLGAEVNRIAESSSTL